MMPTSPALILIFAASASASAAGRVARLWGVLALALCATAFAGCSSAPFGRRAGRPTPEPPVLVGPSITLEGFAVEPWVALHTGSDTPSPSFSVDGKVLVYRVEAGAARRHDQRAELHVLRLRDLEDRILATYEHQRPHTNAYDMYGYETPPDPTQPTSDVLFHPAAIDGDAVFAGSGRLYDSFLPPTTWRFGSTPRQGSEVSNEAALPVLSPNGTSLLLQTPSELVVVALDSAQRTRIQGFMGVWSPDGSDLLVHDQPYGVDFMTSRAELGGLALAYDTGGLTLVREEKRQRLTETGGHPTWHPSGARIVYEQLANAADASTPSTPNLVELTLDGVTERPFATRGRDPDYHPSGAFVVFERDGELVASDGSAERALGIVGSQPRFNATGAFLTVLVPSQSRGKTERDVVVYRVGSP